MRIISQITQPSSGNDKHTIIVIDWFDREWKIILNDNCVKKITTVHLWDNGWRPFDNRTHEEAIVNEWIAQGKIIKLKYRIQ
tara:strand:- start:567 stop:812 length:246 start_codon:yes stop_codon:yes gene_type:complete